jgi:hypothetical protein
MVEKEMRRAGAIKERNLVSGNCTNLNVGNRNP